MENDARKIETAFRHGGLIGVSYIFKEIAAGWKQKKINIGVIGRSGVGKSSFVNAIRGDLNENHRYYAPIGHTECTKRRRSYPHPENNNLIFWDLPGLGTSTFPRNEYLYLREIKFRSYDIFVIMGCDRFTEDELYLADEIRKLGKMFIFVRSKVDTQIESDKILKEKACKVSDKHAVIEEIREDCKAHLGRNFRDIYLVNNMDISNINLDFSKLLCRFTTGFQKLRFEISVQSLRSLTIPTLEQTLSSLRRRMARIVFVACFIPDSVVEAMLRDSIKNYCELFGIIDNDLEVLSTIANNTVAEIVMKYEITATTLNSSVIKRHDSKWQWVTHNIIDTFSEDTSIILNFIAERACRHIDR